MKGIITIIALLMAIAGHGQTIELVRAEIQRQGIPHPQIVLAQARLETVNFLMDKETTNTVKIEIDYTKL